MKKTGKAVFSSSYGSRKYFELSFLYKKLNSKYMYNSVILNVMLL